MKKFLFVLLVMGLVLSSGPVWAKDGFYLGMDLGVAVAPDMNVKNGGTDDWSDETGPDGTSLGSRCDLTINPQALQVPGGVENCGSRSWGPLTESFDGGSGILAGMAVGYRLGSFRVEGEYFYRNTNHDSTANSFPAGTAPGGGYEVIEDHVDDVLSHNFFANLYYDYHSDSKFTPYVGIGIGLAKVSVDYRTLWQRSSNLGDIDVFPKTTPQGEALNQKFVNLLTYDQAKMSDTLFGYQVLAGVDYQVSDPVSIGLKFRYADFGEFEAESAYTKLRGHESVAGNPPVPVTYYIRTDDIQFWGVSLNMKYQF